MLLVMFVCGDHFFDFVVVIVDYISFYFMLIRLGLALISVVFVTTCAMLTVAFLIC